MFSKPIFIIITAFSLIISYSDSSYSSPNNHTLQISRDHKTNTDYFLISYKEKNLWFLDFYQVPDNQLQKRLWQKIFQTKKDMEESIGHLKKKISTPFTPFNKKSLALRKSIQSESTKTIWSAKNHWTWDWEKKYSSWVKTNVDADFFITYNIATDCADVIFALRWIFARINSLPIASSLAGTGAIFSNESTKKSWQHLKRHENWWQDSLFLKALEYILNNTYTHTLWQDSYPTTINSKTFLSGSWFLEKYGSSGHASIVQSIDRLTPYFNITLISSSVPRQVKSLLEQSFSRKNQPSPTKSGFLRMRWPRKDDSNLWTLVEAKSMVHYSKEQYLPEFMSHLSSFNLAVLKNIGSEVPTPLQRFNRIARNIYLYMFDRAKTVEQGHEYCVVKNNDCSKGSWGWFSWSTPSRDGSISTSIANLLEIYNGHDLQKSWSDFLTWPFKIETSNHYYETNMGHLIHSFLERETSYNPNDSIEQRWNLDPLERSF